MTQPTHSGAFAPGTYVYDVVAGEVCRVANPQAYPPEYLGRVTTLVVPLRGSGQPWQATPEALRLATDDEVAGIGR